MKNDIITVRTKAGVQVLDEQGAVVAKEAKFNYQMPENLSECVSMFVSKGMTQQQAEETVFLEFMGGYTVTIQGPARKVLEARESNDVEANSQAVQEFMDSWKYGDKTPRGAGAKVDHIGAILAGWDNYSPEEQQKLLAALGQKAGLSVPAPEESHTEVESNRRPARAGR